MKKITNFIVNKRYLILIIFILLAIACAIISNNVNINNDMTKYLPSTSETRKGMDIMEDEFSDVKETSSLNVMFKGLKSDEKLKIHEELEQIENVSSVDYDESYDYNRDDYTLYVVNVDDTSDSEIASSVYNEVTKKYEDYDVATSGAIKNSNIDVLPTWIIVVAVVGVLAILLIMCESYIEPLLFLFSILIAILLNNGTNVIFSSVSMITSSISAILQLALSMDYSIMLMNRFRQEKENEENKIKAMQNALYNAFKSISSSSVTTIVGLVALVFMSFTIGKDLGLVLAKGVLFSLISIFCVLPGLILIFDKLITKTKKKTLNIKLNKVGSASFKMRYPLTLFFVVVFIASFMLKGNLNILFTASEMDDVSKVFEENNQIAVIYKNEDEEKLSKNLKSIEEKDNVKEVLGYANTLNEELKYDELVEKLNDLGSDVTIDDYLLKIIYYKYHNPNEANNLTFDDMIKFIQNDVYNNSKMDSELDNDLKKDIEKLSNFTDKTLANKQRTSGEIADILGIDKSNIDDILVYYNSKNNNVEITLNEFVNFMNNKVLTDSKYSASIDNKTKESLKTLTKFTNKNTIQTKYTSDDMADLFGISKSDMDKLYTYYVSQNEVNQKLTLSEFANFVISDVLTNKTYANMFNEETISKIKMLQIFSNTDIINQNMTGPELANMFGINEKVATQILLLKYMNVDNGTKLTIPEVINTSIKIKDTTNYLNGVNIDSFEKLAIFAKNENNINLLKMDKAHLSNIFDNISKGLVDKVYVLANLPNETLMSPKDFMDLIIKIASMENSPIDKATLNSLNIIKMTIDSSVSDKATKYTASEISSLLGIKKEQMCSLYALIDFTNGNINNWKATPYDFANLILNNAKNDQIKNNISEKDLSSLNMLSTIMKSSINKQTFSYSELANFIGSDETSIKNIYGLYASKNTQTKLTAIEFIDFVLNHKNEDILKQNINNNVIDNLNLLKSVTDGVEKNTKYSSGKISSLLGIDKSKLDLIYGLYVSKNINPNQKISLNTLVNFIVNDVINNSDYSENFDNNSRLRLNTIQSIINSSTLGTKYTKDEMIAILSNLSSDLDKNKVELLYLYYGSANEYNNDWKLTVEQFANYLYDNILADSRFENFIDDEMRNNIIDSKEKVNDSKNMLIGDNYSRIVINTIFDSESDDTFNFIQSLEDMLRKENEEIYIIGDSPMAYEMSKTFSDEFNYISILTMIAIFIVVAITFKSIPIPLILVLVIQSAVYMTMGILSLSGGSVYYLALLIVQSILMGSTIDYAILYTSYYIEFRETMSKKDAIINAYNESIHTILTSATILIIVTFVVGKFATAITSKICTTLSEGTLCAEILILVFLPALLATFDRFICKKHVQK